MSIGMALGGCSNFAGSSCGRRGSPENRCPQSFNLSSPRHFPAFPVPNFCWVRSQCPHLGYRLGCPVSARIFRMDALAALFFVIV